MLKSMTYKCKTKRFFLCLSYSFAVSSLRIFIKLLRKVKCVLTTICKWFNIMKLSHGIFLLFMVYGSIRGVSKKKTNWNEIRYYVLFFLRNGTRSPLSTYCSSPFFSAFENVEKKFSSVFSMNLTGKINRKTIWIFSF